MNSHLTPHDSQCKPIVIMITRHGAARDLAQARIRVGLDSIRR